MRLGHLSGTTRFACLLGPMAIVSLFVFAWVILPAARADPRVRAFLARPCLLRATTGIPCPFCGGTRAVALASRGEWRASLRMNPLGTLVVAAGPLAALWLLGCAATGRDLGLTAAGRLLARRATILLVLGSAAVLWAWQIASALWLWPGEWQGA